MRAVLFAARLFSAAAVSIAAPSSFTLKEAAPGVQAAIATPSLAVSSSNAGFVVGSDSVLVVDGFSSPGPADELLAAIRATTPLPVRFLVETRAGGGETGGLDVFRRAGAVVVAHEDARGGQWRPGEAGLPDLTYRDALTLWLGERRVDVSFRPGPAGGSSIVSVPGVRVLFAGGLAWKNVVPDLAGARLGAWIESLDGLLRQEPSSTFVPGRGELGRPLEVRAFRDFLSSLSLAVALARRDGKSGAALVEAVKAQLARRYSGWEGFSRVEEAIMEAEKDLPPGTKVSPPGRAP